MTIATDFQKRRSRGAVPWRLSDAQVHVRLEAQEFGEQHIAPIAARSDVLLELESTVLNEFHRQGWTTRFLEARAGDDFAATACLITEALGYECATYASYLMLPVYLNRVVLQHLPAARRDEYRRECLVSPVVTAFAASEREAGSDLLGVQVTAAQTPAGYMLNGRKEYSSNLRQASYVVVVARTKPGTKRSQDALSWFLVPTDVTGVRIGPRWRTLGLRAMDLSPLDLAEATVPSSHLLGDEGAGLALMTEHLAESRTGIAALAVGIARRARDVVIEHARRRHLYGEKLAHFQDYRFRIAEMEKDIAAARALVWVAATLVDQGEDAAKEASVAKLFAGEMVMRVTTAASAMLGSVGYTGQSVVEKLLRDARHVAIVEGTEPTHKEIIFGHVLRRGAY